MVEWNWRFRGYQTPAGGKPVQDWFSGLPDAAAKDDARDICGNLQKLPNHLWRRPEFDQLENGISEIRFDGQSGTYRFYGYFGPRGERQSYTFLHGAIKKKWRDRGAQKLAAQRRDQIEREEATIHEFEFHERIDSAPEPRIASQGAIRQFTTGQIYRFPNPSTPRPKKNEPNDAG